VGKAVRANVKQLVDRLGLCGRELRVLLAQFGPEAGFMDLRFKHEAQMAFLRFMRLASQCVVVVHPCAQQACGLRYAHI